MLGDVVKVVKDLMRGLGARRVVVRELADCSIVAGEFPDDVYLASIQKGTFYDGVVIKVVSAARAGIIRWSCEDLEFTPHGLYAITGPEAGEIRSRVLEKLEKLRRKGGPRR